MDDDKQFLNIVTKPLCIFSYLIKNVDSFEHENWISKADTYVSQFEPNRSDFLVESFPR